MISLNWKLLEKIENKVNNTSFGEIKKLLISFGYRLDRVRGSHFVFERNWPTANISVPSHNNRVKPEYVKKIIKALKTQHHEEK